MLKGATIFLADLVRHIALDATFDFIAVSGYGGQRQHSGEVKLVKDVDESLAGKNVVLVEDILDTGLTLTYLRNLLLARGPKRLKIALLLDKPARRIQPVPVDYVVRDSDEFVVGYGLDLPSVIVIFMTFAFWNRRRSTCGNDVSSCLSMPRTSPELQPS